MGQRKEEAFQCDLWLRSACSELWSPRYPQLIVDQPEEEAHSIFPPDGRSPESGWRLDQGFHMTPLKQDFTNVSEGHGGWPLILLN